MTFSDNKGTELLEVVVAASLLSEEEKEAPITIILLPSVISFNKLFHTIISEVLL